MQQSNEIKRSNSCLCNIKHSIEYAEIIILMGWCVRSLCLGSWNSLQIIFKMYNIQCPCDIIGNVSPILKGFGWMCITFCHLLSSKPLQKSLRWAAQGWSFCPLPVPAPNPAGSSSQTIHVLTGNSLSVVSAKTRHAEAGKNIINAFFFGVVFRDFGWARVNCNLLCIVALWKKWVPFAVRHPY